MSFVRRRVSYLTAVTIFFARRIRVLRGTILFCGPLRAACGPPRPLALMVDPTRLVSKLVPFVSTTGTVAGRQNWC